MRRGVWVVGASWLRGVQRRGSRVCIVSDFGCVGKLKLFADWAKSTDFRRTGGVHIGGQAAGGGGGVGRMVAETGRVRGRRICMSGGGRRGFDWRERRSTDRYESRLRVGAGIHKR